MESFDDNEIDIIYKSLEFIREIIKKTKKEKDFDLELNFEEEKENIMKILFMIFKNKNIFLFILNFIINYKKL